MSSAPQVTPEIPHVEMFNGQPHTTSLAVAEHFGKLHKNVLQSIQTLGCSDEFTKLNFQLCSEINTLQNNKPNPYYAMTRDGFTLLAMGFTGPQAMRWKEAYLKAFNAMEEQLRTLPQQQAISSEKPANYFPETFTLPKPDDEDEDALYRWMAAKIMFTLVRHSVGRMTLTEIHNQVFMKTKTLLPLKVVARRMHDDVLPVVYEQLPNGGRGAHSGALRLMLPDEEAIRYELHEPLPWEARSPLLSRALDLFAGLSHPQQEEVLGQLERGDFSGSPGVAGPVAALPVPPSKSRVLLSLDGLAVTESRVLGEDELVIAGADFETEFATRMRKKGFVLVSLDGLEQLRLIALGFLENNTRGIH